MRTSLSRDEDGFTIKLEEHGASIRVQAGSVEAARDATLYMLGVLESLPPEGEHYTVLV
jgi:hypothetical protein